MKIQLKKVLLSTSLISTLLLSGTVLADNYVIDKKGMHASIQFKISHLGYSWLTGRFNDFDGKFNYDEKNPDASKIEVTIKTKSVDSNHAERDKHLRGNDFLGVNKFPQAKFVSTSYKESANGKAKLAGKFTLHGITKHIVIDVTKIGGGKDPWGGYRRGFEGKTRITLKDYGITNNLGPASASLDLLLNIEGVKQ